MENMNNNPDGEKSVPPEIQEQFDMFVANGFEILHDEKVSNDLLNRILQSGDPVTAIAQATVDIVNRLVDSAEQNGMKLGNETLVYGSNILMGEIINIAEAAGMQKMTDEQKGQSFSLAASTYIDSAVKSGKMTKEELIAMGKQVPKPEGMEQPGPGGILNRGGE